MAESSRFFNAVDGDRVYSAADWAEYFASFIGNGVFGSPGTNLQVSPGDGMSVSVAAGLAWINGYFYTNDAARTLPLLTADGTLPRIDRVVIRWSLANRAISAAVKTGTAASSPSAPSLQRDSGVYELGIADVYVAAGATSVSSANITDRRGDSALCGTVSSIVSEAHTHDLAGSSLTGALPIAKGGTGAADAAAARMSLGITPANIGASGTEHTHGLAAGSLTGTLPVSKGGTGATDATTARTNLGVTLSNLGAAASDHTHALTDAAVTGTLPISKGGTGQTTVAAARDTLGLGNTTGAVPISSGGTGATSASAALTNLGAAALGHTHALTDAAITDALPISKGGTGQTSAAAARNALGLGNTTGAVPISSGGTGQTTVAAARNALGLGNTTGALPIANGGTGQTSAAAARNALGLGNTTGALPVANGGTGATNAADAVANLGYAANLVIYSSTEPAVVNGKLWLKPIS